MEKFKTNKCDECTPSLPDFLEELLGEQEELDNFDYSRLLDSEDFGNRRIYIRNIITEATLYNVMRIVLRCNMADTDVPVEDRLPIRVYINTSGGDAIASMVIAELFTKSVTPVYTYNIGTCHSGGFIIYLGGHKRYAMNYSYFMIHDGTTSISNTTVKVVDARKMFDDLNDKVRNFIIERSNIDAVEYDANVRADWYFTAEEALQCGLVHEMADDIYSISGKLLSETPEEETPTEDTEVKADADVSEEA